MEGLSPSDQKYVLHFQEKKGRAHIRPAQSAVKEAAHLNRF